METVIPFRAWRYGPSAGELSQLVAPPYDVIGPELQSRLYARSRYNVVRIDLGMTLPSDGDCDNRYTRAADQIAQWKEGGILVRDAEPSVTFVEESFTGPDGRPSTRYGFLALLRLSGSDEGVVFPHEQTFSGPKEDRYRLTTATAMGLSPVFLLYDLPGDEITAAWRNRAGTRMPAATVTGEEGTVTRLWPTSDPDLLDVIGRRLGTTRFIIADGHHRYETALRYKQEHLLEVEAPPGPQNPGTPSRASEPSDLEDGPRSSDYVLAYLGNMSDPGLAIYATHRLISGADPEALATLPRSLADAFHVEPLADHADAGTAQAVISAYLQDHTRGAFGLWGRTFGGAYGLRLDSSEAAPAAAPDHSAAYQLLDVTILQKLVLEKALGIFSDNSAATGHVTPGRNSHAHGTSTVEAHVTFFKDRDDAFARLESGEFQAGFFLNPTGLDQVREVALGGERMPQKATYFYPKLPTGLVFQDLRGRV